VVVALVVAYAGLRRRGTLRAWLLLAGYLVALVGLVVNSRAPSFGRVAGLDYRYLTDAADVLALSVALAFLPLLGAPGASAPRERPLVLLRVPTPAVVALVTVVAGSGLVSSARYAAPWHHDNASHAYVQNLAAGLRDDGDVDLADQPVPDAVVSVLMTPGNRVRAMTDLLPGHPSFPRASSRLVVVAPDGTLRQAAVQPGLTAAPGPRAGCGWAASSRGLTVPLGGRAFDFSWWIRIGYLASADSPVVVRAGSAQVRTRVEAGAHALFVRVDGSFGAVRLTGLDGATLCVDSLVVGQAVPGSALP
jgi:hypothetical protein